MDTVQRFLLTLYTVWVGIVFISLMLVCLPFFLFFTLFGLKANLWLATTLMLVWFRVFGLLTFLSFSSVGKQKTRGARPCVWVGNHNSFLDTPATKLALGYGFLPLGKIEQSRVPILGTIYKHNVVLVDRSSEQSRHASYEEMKRLLRMGISVMIFPEGTMNRTEHLLKAFYDGAFRLAVEAQVPICPFVTVNTRRLMPRGSLRMRPGWAKVFFADPIPTLGTTLAQVPELRQHTYQVMYQLLEQHSPAGTVGLAGPMPEFAGKPVD